MSSLDEMPDDLLVLRCQAGEAAALDTLLGRWQERLWLSARRFTGDEQAAWDILQETCLVIARDIRRLDSQAAFAPWAYRIVRHKALDWWRGDARRRQREAAFAEQLRLDHEEEPAMDPRAGQLRSAVARLSTDERSLLGLRFDEGFGIAEIAAMLDVPAGTVKSRLHYTKQRLRLLLAELNERQPHAD